jgi:tripartite-type tricarboxylate transporter receptor subunit TctC
VRVIVTQAAGGTPDIICRMVCDRLSRALGQPFIVENRPGAGNIVGAQYAARAAPDGYTLLWATAATVTTNAFTVKALPYDPAKNFVTVARVAKGPFFIVAGAKTPVDTLPELIALAKAKPGQLNFATDGPRNFSGLVAAWLDKNAGIDVRQVPYATMPQGVQDTVSGRIEFAIVAIPTAAPLMKGGLLKAIAVSSAERAPGYEQVAPIADTIPGFDFYGWLGLSAVAGTPRDILERLNAAVSKVLDDDDFAKPLANIGFYSFGSQSLEAADKAVHDELDTWHRLVTAMGIEPE